MSQNNKRILLLCGIVGVWSLIEFLNVNGNFINYFLYLLEKGKFQAFAFIFATILSLISISLIVFIRNKLVFNIFMLLIAIAFIVNATYSNVNGGGYKL